MSAQEVQLVAKREIAEGTTEFRFTWPHGFEFRAGQAIELLVPEGHAFSLVNAPGETELVIATRMRDSAYKRTLAALPIGGAAQLEGPFGSLTLHRNPARAAVLVAGGIGITPFMSILRHAARHKAGHRFALVYSNRRRRDAAYLDEITALVDSGLDLRLVNTLTEEGGRFVDADMIRVAADGLASPVFYVAGPPAMVEASRKAIEGAGFDDTDIRAEEFFGYESAPLKDEAHRAEAA
jgi:ferredoxin-NADP reductase